MPSQRSQEELEAYIDETLRAHPEFQEGEEGEQLRRILMFSIGMPEVREMIEGALDELVVAKHIERLDQQSLKYCDVDSPEHRALESALYDVLQKAGDVLPDLVLNRGEVRVEPNPKPSVISKIFGKDFLPADHYVGTYLGKEKVVVKAILHAGARDAVWADRLKKEGEAWNRAWRKNKSYIVPIYGFIAQKKVMPWISAVYPKYDNGTVVQYLDNNPSTDHMRIIRRIAEGMNALHNMCIIHGDLRGANIVIDKHGNPLIGNFDLDHISNSRLYAYISQEESGRWRAPEMLEGRIPLASADVYMFAMTALEVLTHKEPYYYIERTSTVLEKIRKGVWPEEPKDAQVIQRGLHVGLWLVLSTCWMPDPGLRPEMKEVIHLLERYYPGRR
ncbi:kinase-like protein [Gloeophyllum trabeum ATCC 11539]|uniref:Kinase-like protein n=1 Tax=Gloeophyllum trabeum (strain ATCC 11539 / FP-39264 / Madison 617) TaxID=670483 RepID=S7Q775_GLOTA|nr:kinase-like protein [Gloeophyllum trabeum ATCC 11539]EPQ55377.1 kinase-like protein [Gloeophyllum trabeum ATCC 11539]